MAARAPSRPDSIFKKLSRSPGSTAPALLDEADTMHALLVLRADNLGGCTKGSREEAELKMISEAPFRPSFRRCLNARNSLSP
jgi:hypothetical protein